MNAEQLKQAVQKKKEIDQVAAELGYENASEAAADLRALGILPPAMEAEESSFVEAMTTEPPPPKYEKMDNASIRALANRARRGTYAHSKVEIAANGVGNKYITVRQFSLLLNGVEDFSEAELFTELIDNIFDLHNFNKIPWTYSHHQNKLYRRYVGLYPAMSGVEHEMPSNVGHLVGSTDPIPVEDRLPAKVAKSFKKKEVGIIAAAFAVIGFVLGALLF